MARRASNFKQHQAAQSIVKLFEALDVDKDGTVSCAELARLLRFVTDGNISNTEVESLISLADRNDDGFVNITEFMQWIFCPKARAVCGDVRPSIISATESPTMVRLLQEWFSLIDTNKNGFVEFEELAVSLMQTQDELSDELVKEEYNRLDLNGDRRVTWPEFLEAHARLIDAMPRPIEDKVKIVRARLEKLTAAIREHNRIGAGRTQPKILHAKDLIVLLKERYGSLENAFTAIDADSSGFLSLTEIRATLDRLLELPPGTHVGPVTLRKVFEELDGNRDASVDLEDLYNAEKRAKTGARGARKVVIPDDLRKRLETKIPIEDEIEHVIQIIGWHSKEVKLMKLWHAKQAMDLWPDSPGKQQELVRIQSSIEAERGAEASRAFCALEVCDSHRVTCTEFRTLIWRVVSESVEFKENKQNYGSDVAVRVALHGWLPGDIFKAIDKDMDGYISIRDWDRSVRRASPQMPDRKSVV